MRPRVRCSTPRRTQLPPQLGTPAGTTLVATLARSDCRRGVTGTRGTHALPRKENPNFKLNKRFVMKEIFQERLFLAKLPKIAIIPFASLCK
jgi:hypothetical protein